jgi:hypothetical protein
MAAFVVYIKNKQLMLSDDQIGMVTIACCFLLSELLPFVTKTDANGFLHMVFIVATQMTKTLKERDVDNSVVKT